MMWCLAPAADMLGIGDSITKETEEGKTYPVLPLSEGLKMAYEQLNGNLLADVHTLHDKYPAPPDFLYHVCSDDQPSKLTGQLKVPDRSVSQLPPDYPELMKRDGDNVPVPKTSGYMTIPAPQLAAAEVIYSTCSGYL